MQFQCRDIYKAFGTNRVLTGVDFELMEVKFMHLWEKMGQEINPDEYFNWTALP